MKAWAVAVALWASAAGAAPFLGKQAPANGADLNQCYGLGAQGGRLRSAFGKGSTFPDQVYGAFAGQGSGDATAGDYLARGQELSQLVDTVAAQCQATFGSAPAQPVVAAPILRRVAEARHTAELYLDLPRAIDKIDADQNPAALALRPEFLTAMYKIADGGDYGAASTLADDAHAKLARLP